MDELNYLHQGVFINLQTCHNAGNILIINKNILVKLERTCILSMNECFADSEVSNTI